MSKIWFFVAGLGLFATIGTLGLFKKKPVEQEVAIEPTVSVLETPVVSIPKAAAEEDFPKIDRIFQLFTTGSSKLPIVETVTYSSSVSWLKERLAWLADYAVHYNTSRHFIARSLHGKPDYFSQHVTEGSKFNVFCLDKQIQFHLLVDLALCKMGFYYVDLDTNERVLLKTYQVGLGKPGSATPEGIFRLGEKVAIYQPGVRGFHQGREIEMRSVFGSRWMPMLPMQGETAFNQGYGLQGVPIFEEGEESQGIGGYSSDGCIRLKSADIEEIFAIVVSKPAFVHVVQGFHTAKLPGVEVAAPSKDTNRSQ